MSEIAIDAARLINMLPENDQSFAYEFIKKLVLAWDPDFTKLTLEEARRLEEAERGRFFDESEIDWEHLEQYADQDRQ